MNLKTKGRIVAKFEFSSAKIFAAHRTKKKIRKKKNSRSHHLRVTHKQPACAFNGQLSPLVTEKHKHKHEKMENINKEGTFTMAGGPSVLGIVNLDEDQVEMGDVSAMPNDDGDGGGDDCDDNDCDDNDHNGMMMMRTKVVNKRQDHQQPQSSVPVRVAVRVRPLSTKEQVG